MKDLKWKKIEKKLIKDGLITGKPTSEKRIYVSHSPGGSLVLYLREGCSTVFCCTPKEWEVYEFKTMLEGLYSVPKQELMYLEDLIKEVLLEEHRYDY
jgi:hypothetical protein